MKTLLRNRKALTGLVIIAFIVLVAIAAPLLTQYDPAARTGRPHQPPSLDHILGTTRIGQDVFARLIYGARTSLAVGFGAGLLITLVGTALGIISGYRGGKTDEIISFFTNMVLVVPNLPLLLVLAAFIGQASPSSSPSSSAPPPGPGAHASPVPKRSPSSRRISSNRPR